MLSSSGLFFSDFTPLQGLDAASLSVRAIGTPILVAALTSPRSLANADFYTPFGGPINNKRDDLALYDPVTADFLQWVPTPVPLNSPPQSPHYGVTIQGAPAGATNADKLIPLDNRLSYLRNQ